MEAFSIWAAGNKAVFGHPFRRSMRVKALEEPFILSQTVAPVGEIFKVYIIQICKVTGGDGRRRMTKEASKFDQSGLNIEYAFS